MSDELSRDPPASVPPGSGRRRFSLKSAFHESPEAIFVLGPGQRLRYANPAWERLTGQRLSRLRGTRISARRRSSSSLWQTLAPPPEVWDGEVVSVRRAPLEQDGGPPWWEIRFLPIRDQNRVSTVIAIVRVLGRAAESLVAVPAIVGEFQILQRQRESWESIRRDTPAGRKQEAQLRHAAKVMVPLWLIGEPGTGKRTLARVIHANGPRRSRPFIAIDGRQLPGYLIESMLFGNAGLLKTDAIGTLYLSHLPRLPRDLQQRLAERLRPGGNAVPRLIIGSDQPADLLVSLQQIPSLYLEELSVLEMSVPPLRSRLAELPSIVTRMLRRCSSPEGNRDITISPESLAILAAHSWPGNLRELAERIQEAVEQVEGREHRRIEKSDLPRYLQEKALIAADPRPAAGPNWSLEQILETVERRVIAVALADAGGSQTDAATRLGMSRARLGRRIEVLGISLPGKALRTSSNPEAADQS